MKNKFVEKQIMVAKANQHKLLKKLDLVKAEYERLKEEDEKQKENSNFIDLKISQSKFINDYFYSGENRR